MKNVQGLLHLCPNALLNKQGFTYYGWMRANKLVLEIRIMIKKCAWVFALAPRCSVK